MFWLLCFQSDDAYNPDRMYDLVAVVVHIGSSLNRGHYISIVKSEDIWILFDDDLVDVRHGLEKKFFLIPNVTMCQVQCLCS